jgi:hypothetical protein
MFQKFESINDGGKTIINLNIIKAIHFFDNSVSVIYGEEEGCFLQISIEEYINKLEPYIKKNMV